MDITLFKKLWTWDNQFNSIVFIILTYIMLIFVQVIISIPTSIRVIISNVDFSHITLVNKIRGRWMERFS